MLLMVYIIVCYERFVSKIRSVSTKFAAQGTKELFGDFLISIKFLRDVLAKDNLANVENKISKNNQW